MQGHLQRRHSDKKQFLPDASNPIQQTNTTNNNHIHYGIVEPSLHTLTDIQKITNTVEQFSTRILETERLFRQDLEEKMEQKLQAEVQRRQNVLEEGYKQERLRYSQEIQELKVKIFQFLSKN